MTSAQQLKQKSYVREGEGWQEAELTSIVNIHLNNDFPPFSHNTSAVGARRLATFRLRFDSRRGSFASNLEQVVNLLCAQVNSASYPQRDRK